MLNADILMQHVNHEIVEPEEQVVVKLNLQSNEVVVLALPKKNQEVLHIHVQRISLLTLTGYLRTCYWTIFLLQKKIISFLIEILLLLIRGLNGASMLILTGCVRKKILEIPTLIKNIGPSNQ